MHPKTKFLLQEEVQAFIQEHREKSGSDIALMAHRYPDWDMPLIAQQIDGLQKAKQKIPSWTEKSGLLYPVSLSMEQCSSEQTASYKATICTGESFIDLTGGFGVDSFFLSQSFKKGIHCELNENLQALAAHNFKQLSAPITSIQKDGLVELAETEAYFDLIYVDPARRDDNKQKVISLADYTPNILTHHSLLLEKGAQVLIKTSPMLDIKQVLQQVENIKEVHVVSLKNECKEVLYLLEKDYCQVPSIHCLNLPQKEAFVFHYEEEDTDSNYSYPQQFIYEPNSAILKAGAFHSVARNYQLKKLHPNSHLYTSNELKKEFPGRVFELIEQCGLQKKTIKRMLPKMKANISRRNFPLSVAQIRQKTGIKEGGEYYLFASTLLDDKPQLLICKKA
jgi:16S rRNA G966 N2-methylase RsmD